MELRQPEIAALFDGTYGNALQSIGLDAAAFAAFTNRKYDTCQANLAAFLQHPFDTVVVLDSRYGEVKTRAGFSLQFFACSAREAVFSNLIYAPRIQLSQAVGEFNSISGKMAQCINGMALFAGVEPGCGCLVAKCIKHPANF